MDRVLLILILFNFISCSSNYALKSSKKDDVIISDLLLDAKTKKDHFLVINQKENCFYNHNIDSRQIFTVDYSEYHDALDFFLNKKIKVKVTSKNNLQDPLRVSIDYSLSKDFNIEVAFCKHRWFHAFSFGIIEPKVSFRVAKKKG